MTGTAKTTRVATLSLVPMVDGLLYGKAWDGPITYAFPTLATDYSYTLEPGDDFGPATTNIQAASLFAFSSVSGFTNADLTLGTATTATIRVAVSGYPATAYANPPSGAAQAGDVWLGRNYDFASAQAGNYAWHSILHEIGHALGLKHGHEVVNGFPVLPAEYDGLEYSIMTYRSYPGGPVQPYGYGSTDAPQTYMMADIAALQYLYGADFSMNSGNTTYKWSPTNGDTLVNGSVWIDAAGAEIFATIWDGEGVDTYDLSDFTTDLTINLAPGASSAFNTAQLANLGSGHYAAGNIYNAMLWDGDTRSLIENAIGGSGDDALTGNEADNALQGKGGIDTLYGLDGDDVLTGNGKKDHFHFIAGHDEVTDFTPGTDKLWIDLPGFDYTTFLALGQTSGGTVTLTLDGDTSIELDGVRKSDLSEGDFRFAI